MGRCTDQSGAKVVLVAERDGREAGQETHQANAQQTLQPGNVTRSLA
jgi:hypothetical protein